MTDSKENTPGATTVPVIDYDRLSQSFEESLVTKLRGNTPEEEFLALWVPDSDPVEGILSMIDAVFESGRQGVAIRVSRETLGQGRLDVLARRASDVGQVTVVGGARHIELRVDRLQAFTPTSTAHNSGRGVIARVEKLVPGAAALSIQDQFIEDKLQEILARQSAGDASVELDVSGAPTVEARRVVEERAREYGAVRIEGSRLLVTIEPRFASFASTAPAFRASLQATSDATRHEGTAAGGVGLITLEARRSDAVLSIAVDSSTNFIHEARHKGADAPVLHAVLEAFCGVIEGLPLQDASDYSGFRLLHLLRDRGRARPVRGIMRTVNAGALFDLPIEMIRELRQAYGEQTGYVSFANGYDPAPSPEWVALEREEMLGRIGRALAEFEAERKLAPETMTVLDLTRNTRGYFIRVFVGFAAGTSYRIKPPLMFAFERWLKDRIEGKLEVYHEEMKDKSQLRRL